MQIDWDIFYLKMAKFIAQERSKDPSTKTGAVITRPNNEIVSCGYNGFARKVRDDPKRYADRELKYKMVVHCEVNAIVFAKQDLTGCTLYTWPFGSCSVCAGVVIQSGITRVVFPQLSEEAKDRWGKSIELSTNMFLEAGVKVVELCEKI